MGSIANDPAKRTPSLGPLLSPSGVAVVGVKGGDFDPTARDSMARRFFELLVRHRYEGSAYPVNPHYATVGEFRCYAAVSDIPGSVDVALLIVPKARVAASIADCAAKGVKVVVIVTSGFAESGPEGKADEIALTALARSHGMRILGPNCFGYLNSHCSLNLFGSASLLTRPLLQGAIGFVTQSGALAASVVDRAQERGIGFSCVLTTGNQADIDNSECLEMLLDDPHTRVVSMFMEGVPKPERLRAVLRRAAQMGKPCLVLKTGASEVAREAALSHTGSLVGNDAVYDAVFRQEGVIRCTDPDDLFLTAALLSNHCSAASTSERCGVAVLSMSGAMGGILADGASRYGITLAEMSAETRRLLSEVPGVVGCLNPLDAAMATWAADFGVVGRIAGILASDKQVGVVVLALSGLPYAERLVDDCSAAVRQRGKVFVPIWAADRAELQHGLERLAKEGVVVYETPEPALKAIKSLDSFRSHQRALRSRDTAAADIATDQARRHRAIELLKQGGAVLNEQQSKELLALYGIEVPHEEVVRSAEEAVTAAERLGYPVVLKIHSADVPHKTDAGGVALRLQNANEVRQAFQVVLSNVAQFHPEVIPDAMLVAPMAPPGLEMLVGSYQDRQFGAVVVTGLGGTFVEVLADTAMRLAPLSESDATAMLSELRSAALLDGVRGSKPRDRGVLIKILVAVSELVSELKDHIEEVDLNPVIVHEGGRGVTIADALIVRRKLNTA